MSDCPYPIDSVLTHYGWDLPSLRGSGWQKIRCGDHEDSHASASINLDLNAYKCFGCEASGDSISYIRAKEGCSYREAVRIAETITAGDDRVVREPGWGGGGLPSQQRNPPQRRGYIPPRFRNKSA